MIGTKNYCGALKITATPKACSVIGVTVIIVNGVGGPQVGMPVGALGDVLALAQEAIAMKQKKDIAPRLRLKR